ncbi:hypothetical protein SEA_BOOMERJR_213 [Streptomyces phage BoomerJR]|uniref:Uncharacterized protein n=2 Tax=Streptomyces virus Yaboi TaxID=2846408 RepID=A0A411C4S5_9CAUD|nr:hypothetical protein SEA_GENIE2_213 [Streptomyces phage Genie2]QAY12828.1 hypothetical protein SEA_BOOMERJR_213 [Streptomyces phage BoomerJR]WNM73765.1 hypothetical protein SEA_SOLLERTIA_215 [Streptomyces phage Sollertia]
MNSDLKRVVEAGKFLGTVALDTAELALLLRNADTAQKKAAQAYLSAFEEQRGKCKTQEDWKMLYNGVKKRLTV